MKDSTLKREIKKLYRQLSEEEIIWLKYYSYNPAIGKKGPYRELMEKHPDIFHTYSEESGSPSENFAKNAIVKNWKQHLFTLGLTRKIPGTSTYYITSLGEFLLKYMAESESD